MKILLIISLVAVLLSSEAVFAQVAPLANANKTQQGSLKPSTTGTCTSCGANVQTAAASSDNTRTIPGTNEKMPVGNIENLIPIGILTVLGCETCSAEAVKWAIQQGSSFEDVDRTLRTVAAMQNLDCFKQQFGPDVITRMQKPLASAREALQAATTSASKSTPR